MSIEDLKFEGKSILVIGDSMIDEYCYGQVLRKSPEADVPVLSNLNTKRKLGGAANVARNIVAMGAHATLLSVIGNDSDGAHLKRISSINKIDCRFINDLSRKTTVKSRYFSGDQQLLRIDREDTMDLNQKTNQSLLDELIRVLKSKEIDVVILQDYNKGTLNPQNISTIINLCKERSVIICVDPKTKNVHHYKNVDIIKPNINELRALTRDDLSTDTNDLSASIEKLNQELMIDHWYATLSDQGVFYYGNNKGEKLATTKINNPDVCGAGDSVMSIIALAYSKGFKSVDILKLCNIVGGIACNLNATSVVTIESIRKNAIKHL